MPAQSVDPGVDEERKRPAVGGDPHRNAGEEREDGLGSAHRAATEGLTARTYPVGGTGNRCGSDQRAVMRQARGSRRSESYSPLVLRLEAKACCQRVLRRGGA